MVYPTIGEKCSTAKEPPIPGCHMLDKCFCCIYFPEVPSLLILSKVRFQGIPRCFFFSSMLVVRLLQFFGEKWPDLLAVWHNDDHEECPFSASNCLWPTFSFLFIFPLLLLLLVSDLKIHCRDLSAYVLF